MEELLTTVEPPERVFLAIEHGKGKLVVAGHWAAIFVVLVLIMAFVVVRQ